VRFISSSGGAVEHGDDNIDFPIVVEIAECCSTVRSGHGESIARLCTDILEDQIALVAEY